MGPNPLSPCHGHREETCPRPRPLPDSSRLASNALYCPLTQVLGVSVQGKRHLLELGCSASGLQLGRLAAWPRPCLSALQLGRSATRPCSLATRPCSLAAWPCSSAAWPRPCRSALQLGRSALQLGRSALQLGPAARPLGGPSGRSAGSGTHRRGPCSSSRPANSDASPNGTLPVCDRRELAGDLACVWRTPARTGPCLVLVPDASLQGTLPVWGTPMAVQAPKASLPSRNSTRISVSTVSRGRKLLLETEAMKQSPHLFCLIFSMGAGRAWDMPNMVPDRGAAYSMGGCESYHGHHWAGIL
ncbi:uncharacterized protein [Ciconia boyciana]|uniref:uncharacterized protein n=1 Tax=Ciconia boyciana TaxID=52775 RepID=UPI003B9EF31B